MFQQGLHIFVGGILNAPIGVVNDPLRGIAMRNGHPENFQVRRCIDVRGDGISNGPEGEEVHDDRQILFALLGRRSGLQLPCVFCRVSENPFFWIWI